MQNNFPKVSVMVPTYNQENFIGEALDSILLQDYPNLEIVVADDASTDNTVNIIRNYQRRYPEKIISCLNKVNQGVTKNCDIAFHACTGELVALTAGDDLFLPGKITAQVQDFINDQDVVLSYHPVEIFDSATNKTLFVTHQKVKEDINSFKDIITKCGMPAGMSVMVRKSACPSYGYDKSLLVVSDWLFFIEVALKGKVVKLNKIYGRYRRHNANVSEKGLEILDEALKNLDIVLEKYSYIENIEYYCNIGKARYLAGEAFRQLKVDPRIAKKLIKKALAYNPHNFSYRLFLILTIFAEKSKFFNKLIVALLANLKYVIKRYSA